jgi:hypothetical protein
LPSPFNIAAASLLRKGSQTRYSSSPALTISSP